MRSRKRQKGLGWFGLLFVFGVLALFSIVTMKSLPVYLNQMKVERNVHRVASDGELKDPGSIRKTLEKYWDIDSINTISWKDVKIERTEQGRVLSYEYENQVHLFYNISLVFEFADEVPMAAGSG